MQTKFQKVFIEGAISPEFIADCLTNLQSNTGIGAHDIFLGQVRADTIDGKTVSAIEYTSYENMALQKFDAIRQSALEKFELSSISIFHSTGKVAVGEICLFVLVSSAHRREVFEGLHHIVEEIKKEVPVFGKELFEDDSYKWKVNT
ncbi:molybdenum cofactor biosynthesis protein MoaE [Croceivirga thetidis]|uniref:Molybdopterin synthase catalytic subunit n=1 Tax=Croceivirga thetidis TaxID=2721623 RepID=A0ABX1GLV3_9FLAO|nr:molybdenum cofactor biosynthesis protein MoaE [Croceivirga thetidis]NKI30890.1 molybdenum cofactor biosynthesis protein MoaE [Croceivirga thetidis]